MPDSLWNYRVDLFASGQDGITIIPAGTSDPRGAIGWLASISPRGFSVSKEGHARGLTEASCRLLIAAAIAEHGDPMAG